MNKAFKNLVAGDMFFDGDQRFKKIIEGPKMRVPNPLAVPGDVDPASPTCETIEASGHNAIAIGDRRFTKRFEPTDRVETSEPLAAPSSWRCWLIRRAFLWHANGSLFSARVAWKLARIFATENVNMRLAAYSTHCIMNGVE